jgi:Rha family phage regulatory protein
MSEQVVVAAASTDLVPVITIVDGHPATDSRDVAEFFGKNHKDVLRAIRDLSCTADFRGRNFAPFKINDLSGESTSHVLMTKNGFTFLAMGFTGEKAARFKEAYINQFDAMEAELRQRPAPQTREQQIAQALLLANETMQEQAHQIAVLVPKAEALDRISTADGSLNITEAAKALQVRPKDLFTFLSTNGWTYRRAGSGTWLGYQTRTNAGDLVHKVETLLQADGSERVCEQVRVTPQGLTKLAKLMPGRLSVVAA